MSQRVPCPPAPGPLEEYAAQFDYLFAVTSLWADERVYYPLQVQPYTPAERLPKGKKDPAFRTKPQIAVELVDAALAAGVVFRAVVADCFYSANDTFEGELSAASLPYVLGIKPSKGIWAPGCPLGAEAHTPKEAAWELRWDGPEAPGDWTRVVRRFRDGHEEDWWAADLILQPKDPYGLNKATRVVVATTDPATLPDLTTWYLATNLLHPSCLKAVDSPVPPADLAEVVRLYGLRNWVEQSYKQVKHELGWADFMVRSDQAIRRHWQLVCCAFSFCWRAWFDDQEAVLPQEGPPTAEDEPTAPALMVGVPETENGAANPTAEVAVGRGENQGQHGQRVYASARRTAGRFLASHPTPRPSLAAPLDFPLALLARVVELAPAAGVTSAARLGW